MLDYINKLFDENEKGNYVTGFLVLFLSIIISRYVTLKMFLFFLSLRNVLKKKKVLLSVKVIIYLVTYILALRNRNERSFTI